MAGAAYEVKTEHYSGPFEKLLELIEEKKMDITAVNLSAVTADFLAYLKVLERVEPAVLADFLVVAARLILLKSKALMPELVMASEEEEEVGNLEDRLRLYRHYKQAAKHIEVLAQTKRFLFAKEYLKGFSGGFYPANNMSRDALWSGIASVFALLEQFVHEQRSIQINVVRLEEKIEEIAREIQKRITLRFGDLSGVSASEIIVSFLAVLMLLKDKLVEANQEENFGEIHLKRSNSGTATT